MEVTIMLNILNLNLIKAQINNAIAKGKAIDQEIFCVSSIIATSIHAVISRKSGNKVTFFITNRL